MGDISSAGRPPPAPGGAGLHPGHGGGPVAVELDPARAEGVSLRSSLLVDDEVDFVASLGQRLELRGLPTLTATSGPDALEILRGQPVDVVVLDVRMPGMDGIETLRRIKEAHPLVEVVMLTGHADLDVGAGRPALRAVSLTYRIVYVSGSAT